MLLWGLETLVNLAMMLVKRALGTDGGRLGMGLKRMGVHGLRAFPLEAAIPQEFVKRLLKSKNRNRVGTSI